MSPFPCPLCLSENTPLFYSADPPNYFHCTNCDLVFQDPDQLPDPAAEKGRYDQHENDSRSPGYQAFLKQLSEPMLARLRPASFGLDFGSGPNPVLRDIVEAQGHTLVLYDPFYSPNQEVFDRDYDFILASEVLEHLHFPRKDLTCLWTCLKPGGMLGIMTGMRTKDINFANWYYIRDPTHVIFFSKKTLEWLRNHWGARIIYNKANVTIYRKG